MEVDAGAFGAWVASHLSRLGITHGEFGRGIDYTAAAVSRCLRGLRKPTNMFVAKTVVFLQSQAAFDHPDEVMSGLALLGLEPEEVFPLVDRTLQKDTQRDHFLEWLRGWGGRVCVWTRWPKGFGFRQSMWTVAENSLR